MVIGVDAGGRGWSSAWSEWSTAWNFGGAVVIYVSSEAAGMLPRMPLAPLTDDEISVLLAMGRSLAERRGRALSALVLAGWDAEQVSAASALVLSRACPTDAQAAVEDLLVHVRTTALYPLSARPQQPLSSLGLTRALHHHGERRGIGGVGLPRLRLTRLVRRLRDGVAIEEIARELGVSPTAVRERLRRNGLAADGQARA